MDPPRLPVDYTTRVRAVSAAQRFPIETVTRIMKHLPSFITWGYNGWKSREEKRFLGQCSLVCTYWAIHLRPEIFSNLVIRTRNDAECLLEFVKVTTLGASIGHYLKDLRVEWSIPSSYPPWAHLVLHLLPLNLFPLKPIIAMVVSKDNSGDPTRDALISPPSPFHDLPRTLPFPASYNVEDIFVQNLHFGSLANLVSFAISALNIKRDRSWLRCTLYLDSSTWSEDVQEAHTPFPNHMLHCLNERHKHLTLCVKARSVPWQYMHSWLSYVSASNELRRAWTLLQTLPKHDKVGDVRVWYNAYTLSCEWEDFHIRLKHSENIRFVGSIELCINPWKCFLDHVNLTPSKLDLAELDRKMSTFPHLRQVDILLPPEGVATYDSIIRARMPMLAGRLKHRLRVDQGVYLLRGVTPQLINEVAKKTVGGSGETQEGANDTETGAEKAAEDATVAEEHPSADNQGA